MDCWIRRCWLVALKEPVRPAEVGKYIVRYGTMRSLGVMSARSDNYRRGMEVVIRSERGVEVGQVLCESTEDLRSTRSNRQGSKKSLAARNTSIL